MSLIGIRVPVETARLIHEIDVPGAKKDTAQLHITLLDLGEEVPIESVAKAVVATYAVSQATNPFWIRLGCVSCFPVNQQTDESPIIAPIISPTLQQIRRSLKRELNREKVSYIDRFPEYRPHITLAYSDAEIRRTKIEPIEFAIQELVLWGGCDGDNRMFSVFPLEIRKNERIRCEKKAR